jgi:DNA invertase Pin-like site-specific DNA recombinase
MKETSRIRFNPGTGEVEVEGSEKFVKTYFNKLQKFLSGSSQEMTRESKAKKVHPAKKTKKVSNARKAVPRKKVRQAGKKGAGGKKLTNIDAVVTLIQGSAEGISTTELKQKTGLTDIQIWNIVNRTAKEGKIRKVKRGLYAAQ